MLAIGAVEDHAALGETVEVRRLDDGVTVAAQLGTQIVDRDEEHVGLFSVRRLKGGGEEEAEGQETGQFHMNLTK